MKIVGGLLAGLVLIGGAAVREGHAREKSPVKTEGNALIMQEGFKVMQEPSLQKEQRDLKLKALKKNSFLKQKIQGPEIESGERLEAEEKIFDAKAVGYENKSFATKFVESKKDRTGTKEGKYGKEKIGRERDRVEEGKLAFNQDKHWEWRTV